MKIIPKFLNFGKTPTRQLIEQNKKKQQFLNLNGVKVKIDGSWGPWLLKLYDKIKSNKLNWFTKIMVGSAMAENPAVMTASGWQQDKEGNYILKRTKESDLLANNLAIIGEAAITAPTLPNDVRTIYNIIRHPIQAVKTASNIGKDLLWFLKNPRAIKVYHVNRLGKVFNLRDAKTASPSNIGVHVTPHKEVSKTFNIDAPVMEAYIPRHNMETIDIGANDYRLLSNNYSLDARLYPSSFYDAAGNPKLFYRLLKKYGANPVKEGNKIYTSRSVSIPLRNETFPNIPKSDARRVDEIILEGELFIIPFNPIKSELKYIRLNLEVNDILSRNGKKVIKYTNTNPMEVTKGDGTCYIVTDPKVFYTPKSSMNNIRNAFYLTKYPFIYALENK